MLVAVTRHQSLSVSLRKDLGGRCCYLVELLLQRAEARRVERLHFADLRELGIDASKARVEVLASAPTPPRLRRHVFQSSQPLAKPSIGL